MKPALINGEEVDVVAVDQAGNESAEAPINAQDTTALDAPTDLDVHKDGLKLIGKGEPNTTVTVKDKSGTVVGTGVVDAAGNLIAHLDKPFTNGEPLDVTLTDAAGNTSAPATVNAKDTTPPDAPSDLVFADDGASITGKAEPGSTVIVRLPNNGAVVGTATADEHGNFTVPVKPALINGEEVDVVAVDQAGNESAEAPINAPDLVAPEIINVTSQDGVIEQIDFVANIVHLDEYVSSAAQVVTGNILANDDGITKIDSLRVGAKEVFVNDPKKGAASIEIEGQYGTLTINKDGSYSYKPNGKAFGVEHFTYETISKLGVKEVAVLEINVGKNVVASEYADHVESSSANDTFTLGAGADTVIYDVLDSTIANAGGNGGNGVDTWTDFNANDGDKIDISKLLDGNQTADNIKDYVTYENGVLKIDRNGQADYSGQPEGKSNYVDLININSDKTLDELLNNNNIVWH